MKLVYTKKGLEFRKTLKTEVEGEERLDAYYKHPKTRISSKFKLNSFLRPNQNEAEGSFKLPDFNNVKVEIVKTQKGEIKEKPSVLVGDAEEGKKISQYDLDGTNTGAIHKLLNDNPNNLHKNASKGLVYPPKSPLRSSSIYDILRTVESPSHWRYFENRHKKYSGMYSPLGRTMK